MQGRGLDRHEIIVPKNIMTLKLHLLLHSFPFGHFGFTMKILLGFITSQGRRGWSKGPLMIVAVALNMRAFSWPSPWRSREMTMEKIKKEGKGRKKITHNHPMWESGFELDHTFQVFDLIIA